MESLKSASVYVADHLSTTWLQAMACNKPTIIFWDLLQHVPRPMVKELFDELEEANILFKSPQSAAAWLNTVYEDPDRWWFGDRCQSVVAKTVGLCAKGLPSDQRDPVLSWILAKDSTPVESEA